VKSEFGEWLRKILIDKGISQTELANRLGLKPPQVSRIISGERGTKLEILDALSDILNVPPEIIYRVAGRKTSTKFDKSYLIEQIELEINDLSQIDQQDILEYVRLRRRIAEERGKYEPNKGTARDTKIL
jgi:transcriptional regulator with XRE-family HTH domain